MIPLLVVLGAALGAPLRHATTQLLRTRVGGRFPWGTLVVNAVGSFVLGAVVGATTDPAVIALVGTGFCGALTTYSAFGDETVRLAAPGGRLLAAVNALGSLLAGLAAAALGVLVGTALTG